MSLFKLSPSQSIFQEQESTAPEINLIPFIDVLLVILIFLMISTTFTRYQELSITLPNAEGALSKERPKEIAVAISADGRIAINGKRVNSNNLDQALLEASKGTTGDSSPSVVIAADSRTPHQAVMLAMESARNTNLPNVVFATQSKAK
jgi:biopolymer transport protein ExbD